VEELKQVLTSGSSQWLLSLPDLKEVKEIFKDFNIKRIRVRRPAATFGRPGVGTTDFELLISNYPLKEAEIEKAIPPHSQCRFFKEGRCTNPESENFRKEVGADDEGCPAFSPKRRSLMADFRLAEFLEAERERIPEEEKPMTREEMREEAERLFGDPYLIELKKPEFEQFVMQHHERGLWHPDDRKEFLNYLRQYKAGKLSEAEMKNYWKEYQASILIEPFESLQARAQMAHDRKTDVSAAIRKGLDNKLPMPEKLDISKVVNVGSVHVDLRMTTPDKPYLHGWTLNTPGSLLQYVEDGRIVHILRDKILKNKPDDKTVAQRKAVQPKGWFTIVTKRKPEVWAKPEEVVATLNTAGRMVFAAQGQYLPGVRKNDYHEVFLFFDEKRELDGRWGASLLPGRPEYERIPGAWWMVNKVHESPWPYILQFDRADKEKQAKAEGLKQIIWNPMLLVALAQDERGREYLRNYFKDRRFSKRKPEKLTEEMAVFDRLKAHGFTEDQIDYIKAKFEEFSAEGGRWPARKEIKKETDIAFLDEATDGLYVYGVFLVPRAKDSKGQWITDREILKAIRSMQDPSLGIMHREFKPGLRLTQVFQAPNNFSCDSLTVKAGSAVAEMRVDDEETKNLILTGKLRGFSIRGQAVVTEDGEMRDLIIQDIDLVPNPAIRVPFVVR